MSVIVSWYDYNGGNVPISYSQEEFETMEQAEKFTRLVGFDKELLPYIYNEETGEYIDLSDR
jgi:hypothetical protein